MGSYEVYILRSQKNGRHYIGYTSDLDRRLIQHNEGINRSTKSGIPWGIIYTEPGYKSRKEALRREKEIKSWKGGIRFKQLIEN
jgi:putative endonuclease